MNEFIDYVLVENTRTIDLENPTNKIMGMFVGTKNNLYFFKDSDDRLFAESEHEADSVIRKKEFSWNGEQKLSEFILQNVHTSRTVRDFERFIAANVLSQGSEAVIHVPMEKISGFKVQAGFFGSGIVYRLIGEKYEGMSKFSGNPLVMGLGKDKKKIKKFYEFSEKLVK